MAVTPSWCQVTGQGRDGGTALPGIPSSHPDSLITKLCGPDGVPSSLGLKRMELLCFQVMLGEMRRPVLGNRGDSSLSPGLGAQQGRVSPPPTWEHVQG